MNLLLAATLMAFPGVSDGWVSWHIETAPSTSTYCCAKWSSGRATAVPCDLEDRGYSVWQDDTAREETSSMQIYARIKDGKATRIRALSPQCPIKSPAKIDDLGNIDTQTSIAWLGTQIREKDKVASEAMVAISTHDHAAAAELLIGIIRDKRRSKNLRQEALMWLAHSGTDEAFAFFDRLFASR